ncbi:MAG: glycerol kinase GlpK [Dehalococcoidia bacterium]
MPYILAIDQGTTSSRALIVDANGDVVGLGQQPFEQIFPQPGWVEHDPEEIWSSTLESIGIALAQAQISASELTAIGLTNQRETLVAWDRLTGQPVHNAIVWQDRRTAAICEGLRAAGHEPAFAKATGLKLDPYFSGTKLTWLLQSQPHIRARAEAGEIAAGTVDSWLIWKLTGGKRHATDFTNASRTLLFNINRGRWDESLCEILGVPRQMLPQAQPSRSLFGTTDPDVFGIKIPIAGIAGDQQSALFAQGGFVPGVAKNTYGTGCFLLGQAGRQPIHSRSGLLTSIGAGAGPSGPDYIIEGSVFVAGALIQWLRDELKLFSRSEDVEELARSVPDSGGVSIVPAFTGLGAPDWDPHARGAILGLTRGTSAAHIARAALEAIALSSAELAGVMDDDLPTPIATLRVDGGASNNDLLMQLQADYLGIPVERPQNTETTALGAAYLAGLESGVWSSNAEILELRKVDRVFEPNISGAERSARLHTWRRAVERSLEWARE